jgi:hypothetical protein
MSPRLYTGAEVQSFVSIAHHAGYHEALKFVQSVSGIFSDEATLAAFKVWLEQEIKKCHPDCTNEELDKRLSALREPSPSDPA